jgi:hypothetical protein
MKTVLKYMTFSIIAAAILVACDSNNTRNSNEHTNQNPAAESSNYDSSTTRDNKRMSESNMSTDSINDNNRMNSTDTTGTHPR